MGKVLIIKDANFAQNKIDTIDVIDVNVLTKNDFTILDGVFFSSSNNELAKNPAVKLSEGYFYISKPCTITITANETYCAQVMLVSTIKTVSEYTNGEKLPVVNGQSKFIDAGQTDVLIASSSCYLCVAEYNTATLYYWPSIITYET